jgi:hypothetical protein
MNEEAMQILREFAFDILVAHGGSYTDAMNRLADEWPDLAVTFHKAHALIDRVDNPTR